MYGFMFKFQGLGLVSSLRQALSKEDIILPYVGDYTTPIHCNTSDENAM